ncbi:MAG TPA: hypothetical protein VLG25_00785 [Patescibacteria group bacterium]|nr:hypothetical protein [Patescibacteria group bacterium]
MAYDRTSEQFPDEPLLDIGELSEINDLRAQVPYLEPYLRPDEMVVRIRSVEKHTRTQHPSSIRSLLRLAGVSRTDEIGDAGPVNAAMAFPENQTEPALSKFESEFGRDGIVVAMLLKNRYPKLMRATLLRFAELQGVDFDRLTGEEPGGIFHDNHDPNDPVARKFHSLLGWQFPFYATVDATPLFINELCDYAQRDPRFLEQNYTTKNDKIRVMGDALHASVDWLTHRLDQDPDGLLSYRNVIARGMENQTWKDSFHAYFHKDGSYANHNAGIASVEAQGYAYDAFVNAAPIYRHHFKDPKTAAQLEDYAKNLREKVLNDFWVRNERIPFGYDFFALGADRDENGKLRPMQVRASNMGHLLNSKILDGDDAFVKLKRESVIRNLFSPGMLAVSGIRTVACDEKRFNPYSYHNGGVWPHDNALIAAGLERHGFFGLAHELYTRICLSSEATKCFPEVLQGGDEPEPALSNKCVYVWDESRNMVYLMDRVPQEIQAWVVAAVLVAKSKNPIPGPRRISQAMPREADGRQKRLSELHILPDLA